MAVVSTPVPIDLRGLRMIGLRVKNEQGRIIFEYYLAHLTDRIYWEECMLHGLPSSCCYLSLDSFISEIKRRKSKWVIEKSEINWETIK